MPDLDDAPRVLLLAGGEAEATRGAARVTALTNGLTRIDAPSHAALTADEASDLAACLAAAARLQRVCAAMRAAPPTATPYIHFTPR